MATLGQVAKTSFNTQHCLGERESLLSILHDLASNIEEANTAMRWSMIETAVKMKQDLWMTNQLTTDEMMAYLNTAYCNTELIEAHRPTIKKKCLHAVFCHGVTFFMNDKFHCCIWFHWKLCGPSHFLFSDSQSIQQTERLILDMYLLFVMSFQSEGSRWFATNVFFLTLKQREMWQPVARNCYTIDILAGVMVLRISSM